MTDQQIQFVDQWFRHLSERLAKMAATLDSVVSQVASQKTVIDSAVALLQSLNQKLQAAIASGDPAKVQAISDALTAQQAELAAAVTANTPAAAPTS